MPPYLDEPCPAATLSDIDFNLAEHFFLKAGLPRAKESYFEPDQPIDASTRPLVVQNQERRPVPTLLALLLFGYQPTRFLPGACATLTFYAGKTRAAERSRKVELNDKALPDLISKILGELQSYVAVDIDKSVPALSGEQNRWIYSARALDEAIVNAFAHRDYVSKEPTRVTVFDDRIEIWNPGGAPHGVEESRLQRGEAPPIWRNPSLAAFLQRLGLAQREGQGLRTILEESARLGADPPELVSTAVDFVVRLPAYRRRPQLRQTGSEVGIGEDALILIAIGGPSLAPLVEAQRAELGLGAADILVDFTLPGYVETPEAWTAEAERIRDAIRGYVDSPTIQRFHLFYRGPVVMAPLLGALIVPGKPLWLYHYEDGRYRFAFVLTKRFLVGTH